MIGLGWVMFKRRGRRLFVNKKKQENFFTLGRAGFVAPGPSEQKLFAPLFFKEAASFVPLSAVSFGAGQRRHGQQ
jgi:hypothetical protein